ncbi:pathogenesis-related protein 5-like [Brassica napus]|uniref:(rape) hypothetical protein n=1 Tax=Brassica napus TaxID=3708 RepID=A0A816U4U8_BRANA|nr:pathogenesis-related protein 5-like [Brassica napus]CAF2109516.1 unnamed protein product [Brassica napus]
MANFSGLHILFFSFIIATCAISVVSGTVFTIVNRCSFPVWPGILTGDNGVQLNGGGFALTPGASVDVAAPAGWSGRIWGRTGCNFDAFGTGSCLTGDCGNKLQCSGAGGVPPATLAEFTIGHGGAMDFYDVSLVDGYNVQMEIKTRGGSGDCQNVGCVSDLNKICPNELSVLNGGSVVACKSACEAFGSPQYCCTGAFNKAETCPPTDYSRIFKAACPKAYSYAYDDATSTFTCANANYSIIFCPTI